MGPSNQNMNILYHHRTRAEDAQGIHIREMVAAFRQLGHKVEIVGLIQTDSDSKDSGNSIISRCTKNLPYWLYELLELAYNFYGLGRLWGSISRFKPDLIYERYALHSFAGVLASKLSGVPLILEVNAPLSLEKKTYGRLFMRRLATLSERWICSNAFRTITVTTPLKRILISLGVPPKRIVVMPNGIDTNLFKSDINGNAVRDRYDLNGKTVLGFVGWFRKWHGLEELLCEFDRYKMVEKNIALMLVGDGPAMDVLKHLSQTAGFKENEVIFTGAVPREKIPEHIATFDLCLQPDVTDYASPMKIFEYIAMGRGIIAPAKENICEILGDDYPGLFEPGDFKDMANKIIQFAALRENAVRLGTLVAEKLEANRYFWIENARRSLNLLHYGVNGQEAEL